MARPARLPHLARSIREVKAQSGRVLKVLSTIVQRLFYELKKFLRLHMIDSGVHHINLLNPSFGDSSLRFTSKIHRFKLLKPSFGGSSFQFT